MAAVLSPTATSRDVKAPSWGTIVAVVVVVLAVVGIVLNGVYIAADHAYLQARLGQPGSEERVESALKAVRLNPTNDMYRAEVGLAYQDQVINALTQALQQQQSGQDPQGTVNIARQKYQEAERTMLATIAFVPAEYDNYVFLANLYNLGGQYLGDKTYFEKAISIAKRGIAVERFGPAIRYQYAQALSQAGQTDEAIKQLAYAIKMDPRFQDASVLLATLYAQQGKTAEAKKVLDEAVAQAGGTAPPDVAQAIQSLIGTSTSTPATP